MNGSDSSAIPLNQAAGFMAGFNRYGLPGMVIGALFLIIGYLLYVNTAVIQANTRAMTEMTQLIREKLK